MKLTTKWSDLTLTEKRNRAGITQAQAARLIGRSQGYISQRENWPGSEYSLSEQTHLTAYYRLARFHPEILNDYFKPHWTFVVPKVSA